MGVSGYAGILGCPRHSRKTRKQPVSKGPRWSRLSGRAASARLEAASVNSPITAETLPIWLSAATAIVNGVNNLNLAKATSSGTTPRHSHQDHLRRGTVMDL